MNASNSSVSNNANPITNPRIVQVSLAERSYPIYFASGQSAACIAHILTSLRPLSHVFLIADEAIESSCAKPIAEAAKKMGLRSTVCIVPRGEASKSIEQLTRIWNMMFESNTDRSSLVIAIGGGVIGDLAGFAAASFARGLRFIQVPTTLLAMVDSSVGGKTGINLPKAKNMVGAFWQPSSVLIDTTTLNTLAEREFRSGMAEVVKYGVILDLEFFDYLEKNVESILSRDVSVLEQIIVRSCQLKADVVQNDERETTGLRAILNYGHTFAHAIEAATEYGRWLHGEAVSIGMTMAAELAVRMGMFSAAEAARQRKLIECFGLPVQAVDLSPDTLWELMQHDKKMEQGRLSFILPTRIGHVERRSGIEKAEAIAAIRACSSYR